MLRTAHPYRQEGWHPRGLSLEACEKLRSEYEDANFSKVGEDFVAHTDDGEVIVESKKSFSGVRMQLSKRISKLDAQISFLAKLAEYYEQRRK